jgi:DNA-binding NtrC family response regulator
MSSILVVDDENSILESLKFLLGDKYAVTTCDSGYKALEVIKKENFDIVISDVQLGDINGNEVLQKVKERCKETEVIMISAYPKREYIFDAGKYGACDYLMCKLLE